MAGWLQEIARVVMSFKFSRGSQLHLIKTDKLVTGYLEARTSHFKILLIQYWSLIAFKVIITASMLIVGSFLLVNEQLNIGQFIAAEIVILIVMSSVEKLIGNLDNVYDVLTSVEKLSKLPDNPMEITGEYAEGKNKKMGMTIKVNELNFAYETDKPILQDISFTVKSGEKICISGEDGSGKSTLLRVLTGSYQPYDGIITIDEIPISNYNLNALRSQTGTFLGMQDIFEGTLYENISMGNKEISNQEIMVLARKIGLSDFLETQKEGLQLYLDPAGRRLSRKIIHRILLLRALIHQPRLLLLEEPWLGLEPIQSEKIKNYLLNELKNVTVIVCTNDDSFASSCNQQIHMSNGRIQSIK